MTTDYQLSILSFLVQCPKEGVQYVDKLDENIFDLIEDKLTLQILKKYYQLYQSLPSQVVARQFMEEQLKATPNVSKEISTDLRNNFEDIYRPLPEGDKQKIHDSIILEVQDKVINNAYLDYAEGSLTTDQFFNKISRLSSLVKTGDQLPHSDGGFLVQDRYDHFKEQVVGTPTFLHDLNALTSARGFYSPQLVIFMSGPKHFKTGLLIKLAVEYARDGLRVYYADAENGAKSIRNRAKMAIMECELQELFNPEIQEELNLVLYKFGLYMGGDIYIDSYPANAKSMADVRNRLLYLKEHKNWQPDVIVYDSIDHFIPSNAQDQKRDTRIRIQLVYHEAINLNREFNTFAFAPSQINRNAVGKKVFDMKDLSEDFGKAMNAHAIFSICADDQEFEEGVRRIIPVAQREGVPYRKRNQCIIRVDESRMIIEPLNKEEYLKGITDD